MPETGLHAVTISVDGLAETHDAQRRVPGCFAQALRAIRWVDHAGLKAGVTTQLNRGNLSELEALAPILEDAGVLGWQLQLTLPLGRAEDNRQLALPPSRMPELLRVLRRLTRRRGLRPHLTDNLGYCTSWARRPGRNQRWPSKGLPGVARRVHGRQCARGGPGLDMESPPSMSLQPLLHTRVIVEAVCPMRGGGALPWRLFGHRLCHARAARHQLPLLPTAHQFRSFVMPFQGIARFRSLILHCSALGTPRLEWDK